MRVFDRYSNILIALAICFIGCQASEKWNIEPSGHLSDPELTESSGLASSRQFQGVFWTHNDDGSPRLFAVDRHGELIRSYLLPGASNRDWESIALDDEGNLYMLDNTSRLRSDYTSMIYILEEPDPFRQEKLGPLRGIEIWTERGVDLEAMFFSKDRLYLVTKPWDASQPRAYRVENLIDGGPATFLGTVDVSAMITGADISESGKLLALSSYRAVFIFTGEGEPEELLRSTPLVCPLNAGQIEGISWVDEDLFLTNEQRDLFRVPRKSWERGVAPFFRALKVRVPYVETPPDIHQPLEGWFKGEWISAIEGTSLYEFGRLAWSSEGLHVGIQLPEDLPFGALSREKPHTLEEWFSPGLVYLLINPDGTRPLVFGAYDRCVVLGESTYGEIFTQSRQLNPATVIEAFENEPDWIKAERQGSRLFITLRPETPGLSGLSQARQLGFNLMYIGKQREIVSWTPLMMRFSWDSPSFWGLLETN